MEIECLESGLRMDSFIAEKSGLTRSAVQKLMDSGAVTRGGRPVWKNVRTSIGDVYRIDLPEPEPVELVPQAIPLEVVYEDGDVIVVNKPKGLVVHPAPGHPDGTLVNALLHHCGQSLSGINGELRPGIVHRLDKDTSGLIIAAKNDRAHLSLTAQLKDRSLGRVYQAVVLGKIQSAGVVDAPIGRHHTDRKRMAVTDRNSRTAVTRYEGMAPLRGHTHVQCALETGRTHQIRVHMAHIGHPVLGDPVYGPGGRGFPGLQGQCLHAGQMRFIHPASGERLELEAPLPEYFTEVLSRLSVEFL